MSDSISDSDIRSPRHMNLNLYTVLSLPSVSEELEEQVES